MKKINWLPWFFLALLATLSASAADLLDFVWSGGISDSSVVVAAKTKDHSGTNECRLVVYSDTNFTAQVFQGLETTLATTNNNSVVKLTASTGLVANTTYFYRIEVDGVEDDTKTGRFTTAPPASGGSFKIALGNSNNDPDSTVYDWLKEYDPLFFLNTGDFHYKDINDANETVALGRHQAAYEQNLNVNGGAANQAALYRSTAFAWMWDDHDFGPNDAHAKGSSTTYLTTPEAQSAVHTAYRQTMPHWPINMESNTNFPAGKAPIAQAFTIGRVRFILSDIRSQSEQNGSSDQNATLLGAEQKAWLKEELLKANGTYPLIVWLSTTPWNGAQASAVGNKWYQHTGERAEIANFLKDNHIRGFSAIGGDAHMAAIDDGSNTDYATGGGAGFPIIHAAPIGNKNSYKGGPYSEGANATTDHQYGAMEFEDRTNELVSTWLCLNGGSSTDVIIANRDNVDNPLKYVFTNSWPLIAALSPEDDAEGIAVESDLVLTFNESIQKGTGDLRIQRVSDDALVETIAVTSTAVTVVGHQMTINPASDLQQLTDYYITMDEGVVTDGANEFPGIYAPAGVDYKKWDFTTEGLAIVVNPSDLSVPEGGANTFEVRLSEDPITARTISIAWVSGDADISVTGGASLNFDSGNWSVDQTVTLSAAQDPDAINSPAIIRCSSPELLNVDVSATESDDDPVLHIETSTNAIAVPEGDSNTFQVRLDAQPNATVTVQVSRASGDTDISVSETLFFDAGNYSAWQPVTLSATEDEDYSEDAALIECTSPWLSTQTVTATETENDLGKELPFSETFEANFPMAGTLAAIDGQHGWTGEGTVQAETIYAGSQAVQLTAGALEHLFDGSAEQVQVDFYGVPNGGTEPTEIPADATAVFYVSSNLHIVAYSNQTAIELSTTIVSNDWNFFEVSNDYINDTWSLSVNGANALQDFPFYNASAGFGGISFSEGPTTSYLDNVSVSTNAPEETGLVWDGGGSDANWDTPENWADDVAFSNGDDVIFHSSGAGNLTNVLNGDRTANSLRFNADADNAIRIQGSNVLTIGGGGITVVSEADGDPIIACEMDLNANQIWNVAAGKTLRISGRLLDNYEGNTVTLTGGGTTLFDFNSPTDDYFKNEFGGLTVGGNSTLVQSGDGAYIDFVEVQSGSTIMGSGEFLFPTGVGVTLLGGGILSPGESIGTLDLVTGGDGGASLIFESSDGTNPIYRWEYTDATQDNVNVEWLRFEPNTVVTLDVIDLNGNGMPNGDYQVLMHAIETSGTPIWDLNLPDGWSYDSIITVMGNTNNSHGETNRHIMIHNLVADTDGDTLPDAWENQHYGGPTNANPNATASNGVNTVQEAYVSGINPTSPTSLFAVTDFLPGASNQICWQSVSGRTYTVYWTSNLLSAFTPIGSNLTAASFTDTQHLDGVAGFYKLSVELE